MPNELPILTELDPQPYLKHVRNIYAQMLIFPSKEWAKALCEELNRDEDFLRSVNGWGIDVLLIGKNRPNDVIQYLRNTYSINDINTLGLHMVFDNSCKSIDLLINPEPGSYRYVVIIDYDTWLRVLKRLDDPITALLSVFSKLEIRGSTVTLIRLAANVASPIARVMRKIPTKIIG
jgi:hypothetical protein